MSAAQIYLDAKQRIGEFVRELSPDELAATVPSCPEWTVKDVVAHLAGGAEDFVAGTADGSPEWTAGHVRARKDASIDEILAEWDGTAPDVVPVIEGSERMFVIPLDAVTHEQDVRNAVGKPGARDNEGIDWGLQKALGAGGGMLAKQGAPGLRIVAGDDEWLVGDGDPQASVQVDRYELFRTVLGRRSEAQVRAWPWKGDPAPYLKGLSVFGLCSRDVTE